MTLYIGRESSKVCSFSLCINTLFLFLNSETQKNCLFVVYELWLMCSFFVFVLYFWFEKLWKRICAEVITEINLLAANWKYLLAGLVCQVLLLLLLLFSLLISKALHVQLLFWFSNFWSFQVNFAYGDEQWVNQLFLIEKVIYYGPFHFEGKKKESWKLVLVQG